MLNKRPAQALGDDFFARDTIEVARDLLGKMLVRQLGSHLLSGRIVETEAYLGLEDPSCHSFHGKKTLRCETFYKPAGTIYVYLIYGMHTCLNLITGDEKTPEAVLIRAVQPCFGIEEMQKNRRPAAIGVSLPTVSLCNGPGKLCQAFAIDRSFNQQMFSEQLYVTDSDDSFSQPFEIAEAGRIGLNLQTDSFYWPLRYYIANNSYVSRYERI